MFLSRFQGDFVSMQRKNFNRQKCNTTSSHLKKQFLQSLLFLQKLVGTNPNHPICSDGQEASRQLICSAQLENQPDATTVFIYFLLHMYEICLSELHILHAKYQPCPGHYTTFDLTQNQPLFSYLNCPNDILMFRIELFHY